MTYILVLKIVDGVAYLNYEISTYKFQLKLFN